MDLFSRDSIQFTEEQLDKIVDFDEKGVKPSLMNAYNVFKHKVEKKIKNDLVKDNLSKEKSN